MFYIGTLILLYVLCFCESRVSKLFSYTAFVTFFGFSSLNGADWLNYFDLYTNYDCCEGLSGWYEPGFLFLVYLGQFLGLTYVNFVTILTITICALLFVYVKSTPNPVVTLYILFASIGYMAFQDQYRQGLAVSIVACSLAVNKRIIKYSLLVLASLMHISAILGFVILYRSAKVSHYISNIRFTAIILVTIIGLCSFLYLPQFKLYLNENFSFSDLFAIGRAPYIVLLIASFFVYSSIYTTRQRLELAFVYVVSFFGQISRLSYYFWVELSGTLPNTTEKNFLNKLFILTAMLMIGLFPLTNDFHRYIILNQQYIFSDVEPLLIARERCEHIREIRLDAWIIDACSKY